MISLGFHFGLIHLNQIHSMMLLVNELHDSALSRPNAPRRWPPGLSDLRRHDRVGSGLRILVSKKRNGKSRCVKWEGVNIRTREGITHSEVKRNSRALQVFLASNFS